MGMERLIDAPFSEGLETVVQLIRDGRFTRELAAEIRKPGGVVRALDALQNEFFPLVPDTTAGEGAIGQWPSLSLSPFDPVAFIGDGWKYWIHPHRGDGLFNGDGTEEDPREKELTVFRGEWIQFVFCVKPGEVSISGEEFFVRVKDDGRIRLGPREFYALWSEPGQKTLERLRREKGVTEMYFFVPLRRIGGKRWVLCLFWSKRQWQWRYDALTSRWGVDGCAAVLGIE